jgi:hypothetical protein
MIQQIPIRNGNLPEGKNTYTKFGIGFDDNASAVRSGLDGRVSVMDIVELFWKLSVNNFDM